MNAPQTLFVRLYSMNLLANYADNPRQAAPVKCAAKGRHTSRTSGWTMYFMYENRCL